MAAVMGVGGLAAGGVVVLVGAEQPLSGLGPGRRRGSLAVPRPASWAWWSPPARNARLTAFTMRGTDDDEASSAARAEASGCADRVADADGDTPTGVVHDVRHGRQRPRPARRATEPAPVRCPSRAARRALRCGQQEERHQHQSETTPQLHIRGPQPPGAASGPQISTLPLRTPWSTASGSPTTLGDVVARGNSSTVRIPNAFEIRKTRVRLARCVVIKFDEIAPACRTHTLITA